jgi:hypothetical protein
MTVQELKNTLTQRTTEAEALSQLWACRIGPAPEILQFHRWIDRFGFEHTRAAIERTGVKSLQLDGNMDAMYARKYTTSVARQRAELVTP